MKTDGYYRIQIGKACRYCGRLLKDFVSGIPRDEELINNGIRGLRPSERFRLRNEAGKSQYYPRFRGLSNKSKLSKEERKEKTHK